MDRSPAADRRALEDLAMLVAGTDEDHARRIPLSRSRVLKVVGRRSLPSLIEATIIPSILFYVFFTTVGPAAAMLAALTWAYGSVIRRYLTGQRIPGVLQLAVLGLTVRTIVGLMSGTFMYFFQPIATTVALALVFLGSLWFGQPMIARMAHDFCPLDSEITSRPAVVKLFSGLTLMWAGVHLISAGTTFTLLVTLPTGTFVALKSLVSLVITISAVVFTVLWAIRIAHKENLVFAPVHVAVPVLPFVAAERV